MQPSVLQKRNPIASRQPHSSPSLPLKSAVRTPARVHPPASPIKRLRTRPIRRAPSFRLTRQEGICQGYKRRTNITLHLLFFPHQQTQSGISTRSCEVLQSDRRKQSGNSEVTRGLHVSAHQTDGTGESPRPTTTTTTPRGCP